MLCKTPFLPLAKGRWHRMPILSSDICALPCTGDVLKDKKKNKKKFVCAHPENLEEKEKLLVATHKVPGSTMHDWN